MGNKEDYFKDDDSEEDSSDTAPDSLIQKFVPYLLEGVHSYEGIAFEKGFTTHFAKCILCEQTYVIYSGRTKAETAKRRKKEHVFSVRHETRYAQLEEAQKIYIQQVKDERFQKNAHLVERAQRLGSPQWKLHMSQLVTDFTEAPLLKFRSRQNDELNKRWNNVLAQLAIYEQMERVSLLELAMIKHRMSTSSCDANDEFRMIARITCGIDDVFPLVVQFLGKAPPIVAELRL